LLGIIRVALQIVRGKPPSDSNRLALIDSAAYHSLMRALSKSQWFVSKKPTQWRLDPRMGSANHAQFGYQ